MTVLTQSPGTIWAPWPASPPVFAGGPSVAYPLTVQNSHIAVAGVREQYPGVNFCNWPIVSLVATAKATETGSLTRHP
jgi:hypothetical protein